MKNGLLLLLLLAASKGLATPAPNFTVTTSDNQMLQLYQNFISQGKLVVIEAFFTTCPPCNAHAPLVQNLYTQMLAAHPGKVEFIMLSTLSTDTNVKVATYRTSKGLTMPGVGANGGSTAALQPYTSNQFGVFYGTPTFIVIAPNTGEVHFDIRGGSAAATMTLISQKIAELLPPAPPPPTFCDLKDYFGGNLADVNLHVTATQYDNVITASGSYSLSGINGLQNTAYNIKPTINDNPINGLTTYDLVQISKHILGIQELACDWQLLAADVNCSGTITTYDIVTARKVILGILLDLPCGSWRFVPDSATATNGGCAAFLAVKLGDVYGTPCDQVAPAPDDRGVFMLEATDRVLEAGETAFIEVLSGESLQLQGLQAALHFDPKQLAIRQVYAPALTDFGSDAYNLERQQEGIVPLSWINPLGDAIEANQPVLTFQVTALQGGKLSDLLRLSTGDGLHSEAYDARGGVRPLALHWEAESHHANPYLIQPNPTKGAFALTIPLDAEQSCRLQLIDLQGKIVYETSFDGVVGQNQWEVETANTTPGLYAVRVNGRSAGKVVITR